MHELSVCFALIEQVQSVAEQRGAASVTGIVLRMGPLCGVEPDLLQHAYPLAAAGSIAEHALITIETADIRVRCTECGSESVAKPNHLVCAQCGDFRTQLLRGDEMILQSVELGLGVRPRGPTPGSDP